MENSKLADTPSKSVPAFNSSLITNSVNKEHNIQTEVKSDDQPLLGRKTSKCSNCLRFICTLTIEPVTFLFLFSYVFNFSVISNLIMDKGCRFYFNYSDEVCGNLSGHKDEKDNVEKLANNYVLYSNILSIVAAFMMVFIAPWSDKHGRKLPLVMTCVGAIIYDIGILLCIVYYKSSLNYLILCRLPTEIFGGFICFLTIVFSHASEVSTEKNRTLKYTTIEVCFMTALSVGGLAGGMVLRYYGYFYVYLMSLGMHIVCVLWIVIVVEETAGEGVNATWQVKKRNFFRMDSISKSWKATVRPRENQKRTLILMYIASMCFIVLTYEAFGSLGYIYAHHIYDWDPAKYNTVNTEFMLTSFILMMFLAPLFLKVLKLSDSILGILGSISMMAKNFFIAFAPYNIVFYYIGNAAGFLGGFATLAIRTALSKVTDPEERGLVFSFLATCEALFPMIGSTITTNVFNATINIVPNVAYLASVVFLSFPLITFVWIYIRSRNERYITIINA